jgi:hypothetical protein
MMGDDFWSAISAIGTIVKVYQVLSGHDALCAYPTCATSTAAALAGAFFSALS